MACGVDHQARLANDFRPVWLERHGSRLALHSTHYTHFHCFDTFAAAQLVDYEKCLDTPSGYLNAKIFFQEKKDSTAMARMVQICQCWHVFQQMTVLSSRSRKIYLDEYSRFCIHGLACCLPIFIQKPKRCHHYCLVIFLATLCANALQRKDVYIK